MSDLVEELRAQLRGLRSQMRAKFNRTSSVADLLADRWERAQSEGWGEGSSCYDNVLILGDVRVGERTWVGPNCILDGSGGGLQIGSHCSVSAGVQIYTHDTVDRATTLGAAPIATSPTYVGSGVYIGPNTVIAKGVRIGDLAVIGALSYVDKDVEPGQRVWGCPARAASPSSDGQLPAHGPQHSEPVDSQTGLV